MARDLGRKDFGQDNPDPQHRRHHGDDYRKSLLCLAFFFLREKTGVDRNEGDGSGSTGHQVIKPVGNCEAGDVGVGRRPGAERVGNVGLAHVADHPREHDRRHEQQGGGKGAVLVRRTKPAQPDGRTRDRSRFGRIRRFRHQRAILHANIALPGYAEWFTRFVILSEVGSSLRKLPAQSKTPTACRSS